MRYAHPGSEGAVVSFKSRYGNYINGQFVEPAGGQYFTNLSPVNGQPIAEFPRSDAADIEGPGRCPCRRRCLGQDQRPGAFADPVADRRPHRAEPGDARHHRDLGQRQGGARDAQRRYPAGRRPLPLFRRLHPRPGRHQRRDRRTHRGLPFPRAAGRGGADHPVELPDPDGRLEARPGAGRRQLRGAQTGRADPLGINVLLECIGDLLPPGCSTWCTATAGKPAKHWPRASASPRSPSPAPPGGLAHHEARRRAHHSEHRGLGGKSEHLLRDIMQAEPAFIERPPRGWCWASSTRARCAPARLAHWCRSRSTRRSWKR